MPDLNARKIYLALGVPLYVEPSPPLQPLLNNFLEKSRFDSPALLVPEVLYSAGSLFVLDLGFFFVLFAALGNFKLLCWLCVCGRVN